MKFRILILLFLSFSCEAFAGIRVVEWNESATLTDYGKKSKFTIKIQVVNLEKNSGIKSFTISSNADRNLEVSGVTVNSMAVRFLNQKNSLEIFFSKILLNEQFAYISYEVKDYYKKINKYLRQEPIYIPSFALGAVANVDLDLGDNLELISSHKNLTLKNNKVFYNGLVPTNGVQEILKITNSGVSWKVHLKSRISFNNSLGTLEVTVPYLFRGGAQNIENQTISTNVVPKKHLTTRENDIITFDINSQNKEIIIEHMAKISTGRKFRTENNRPPDKYLEVSATEEALLKPLLSKIMRDPEFDFLPLHVKISKFVHKYLTYDLNYYGKLLSVEEILMSKRGVCSEYATLFNALARVAKIPSSIVHGYALGEYNKFESHAWNMIYIDNHWIHIDPTWNLTSGVVSSSHIYIKDNRKEEIIVRYSGKDAETKGAVEPNIKIDREFDIQESYN